MITPQQQLSPAQPAINELTKLYLHSYFVTNPTHFYLFAVLPADSLPLDPTSRDAALAEAQLNSREQPDQSLQYPTSPISFEVNSASVHPFKYQGQLSYANMTDILAANNLAAYLKESTVTDSMEVDVYIFDQCVRASGGGAGVGDLECFYQGGVKFRLTETASTGSAGGSGNGTVSGNGNANTNGTVAAVQQPSSTP